MRLKPFALLAVAAVLLSFCAGCSNNHHSASRSSKMMAKQWQNNPS